MGSQLETCTLHQLLLVQTLRIADYYHLRSCKLTAEKTYLAEFLSERLQHDELLHLVYLYSERLLDCSRSFVR